MVFSINLEKNILKDFSTWEYANKVFFLISAASGMALEKLDVNSLSKIKPWVYTITPFLIERPFEQIKLDINQQNVNVKLVGFADYPELGPTHAELNAEKIMRRKFGQIICDF